MTAFRARGIAPAVLIVAGLAAGCSDTATPDAGPTAAPAANSLSNCTPLTEEQISRAAQADTLTAHHRPPVCVWQAQRGDDESELTFTFSDRESLQQRWQQADSDGFQTEHLTITEQIFGATVTATGFYIRDPHDPGDCAVAAADNGTIVWRVQNHSHTTTPDPCATALQLATLTIDLAP
ncbi:DUF3558 domain-containing protein [Nocardia sp. NBC_00565]|uniref:DUF3558 family protein n=1 Tax=Nocardia sp. NBC_00565 TaxID=2975993 RepID=UPI002E81B980|nr:DUF3558 family protein [Nocardia sp. NBC_00565]WUC07002.1 DUF3558 domain-containing protein [Nocardia sp. NBC_00565]